jgi:hypothetical protein
MPGPVHRARRALDVGGIGSAYRDRQVDNLIPHLRADIYRGRQRVVIGHAERCSVGKHAGGTAQRELADAQEIAFELDLREPPAVRNQSLAAASMKRSK